jgi:hypothetical protein
MTHIQDNTEQFNRFNFSPPHPSYIAGFIDGDGSIFIRKIVDGYQSGFSLSQSRTNILQIIRYHFGGSITSSTNRNNKKNDIMNLNNEYYFKYNIRNQYNLLIRNNEYQIIVEYLQNSFIIKEEQYKCLFEFNKIANLPNKLKEKEELFLKCSSLNKTCNLSETYLSRLSIEYISGLFDAEGCLFISSKLNKSYLSISQKNHPEILDEIQKYIGFGKIQKYRFEIYNKKDCLKFIKLIKEHLIIKFNQAKAFETYLTTDDLLIKEQMYKVCNKEKHEIEIFTDLNKNENNKEAFFEKIKIKLLKKQICKEIHNKQIYREKSEKMKGNGNHNYGKIFSPEIKQKMSVAIRNAKGGISDENILKVRQLINEGYKNIEIQEIVSLPRHTITRIKNNTLICRNEEKIKHKSLTQIETNLLKRKIQSEEIIVVVEKILDNWKPMQILDYLIDKRYANNIPNNLTIDIIKNIKTKIINKKHVIYESEINQERYEYYLNLFNNIK